MIKFLSGILIVQIITAVMIYIAVKQMPSDSWYILLPPLGVISILTSLWFSSHAKHSRETALSSQSAAHHQEKEKIKVHAERAKRRDMKKNHVELTRQVKRVQTGANIKVAGALVALISLGGLLLFTQLLNLGILIMSTAGGGLAGYVFRGRLISRNDSVIINQETTRKLPWKKN